MLFWNPVGPVLESRFWNPAASFGILASVLESCGQFWNPVVPVLESCVCSFGILVSVLESWISGFGILGSVLESRDSLGIALFPE